METTTVEQQVEQNQELRVLLEILIQTCRDGGIGFRDAAKAIHDPQLRGLLDRYAVRRMSFVGELQLEAKHQGMDMDAAGNLPGTLHKGWLNLNAAMTSGDEAAILLECEHAEDAAVEEYVKAMQRDLAPSLLRLLGSQCNQIEEVREQIHKLRLTCQRQADGKEGLALESQNPPATD